VVFFYLKSAYDSVDHIHLLHALAEAGIGGRLLTWIEDLLKDRLICFSIEDIISELYEINRGILQGSGISTILFILLLRSLPNVTPIRSKEFADDVAYSITDHNQDVAETQMQQAINKFSAWIREKSLKINIEKTKFMCFTIKQQE